MYLCFNISCLSPCVSCCNLYLPLIFWPFYQCVHDYSIIIINITVLIMNWIVRNLFFNNALPFLIPPLLLFLLLLLLRTVLSCILRKFCCFRRETLVYTYILNIVIKIYVHLTTMKCSVIRHGPHFSLHLKKPFYRLYIDMIVCHVTIYLASSCTVNWPWSEHWINPLLDKNMFDTSIKIHILIMVISGGPNDVVFQWNGRKCWLTIVNQHFLPFHWKYFRVSLCFVSLFFDACQVMGII